ncbi:asparaginase [Solibacillus sp. CAU 1738]|uniref:asparaginase n=1 Tax=Solibacillus sp. CAU 1738 TaxID=3140363 RepID=UPI0032601275
MSNLLIEVYRDSYVESKHAGTIVVVNNRGETIAHVGDPQGEIFACSSMKPPSYR